VWPEFNPVFFLKRDWLIVSPFVLGRQATFDECRELCREFRRGGRAFVQDVGQHNVRVRGERMVIIDFHILEHHPDWLAAKSLFLPRASEDESCL
jgi:hypothetical protein